MNGHKPVRAVAAAVLALLAPSARSAEPEAELSLRDALTLPAGSLPRRVLGLVGTAYGEVRRPYLGGVPGRTGFGLEFATAPRSAGFPGLCQAEILSVYFEPPEGAPAGAPARVHALHHRTAYRIVDLTAPMRDTWNAQSASELARRCAAAGPVIPPIVDGAAHGFFEGRYNSSTDFWPAHAYFGARALAKAAAAVAAGRLNVAECRDDSAGSPDRLCDDPRRLLAVLPMDRFLGLEIGPCETGGAGLCVSAGFARGPNLDGRLVRIEMRTSVSSITRTPPEFEVRAVRIRASTAVE